MPKSVTYRTKLVEVSGVELEGVPEVRDVNPDGSGAYHWCVGDDDLEEWLEKFEGQRVRLKIETFGQDESHLLPGEGER